MFGVLFLLDNIGLIYFFFWDQTHGENSFSPQLLKDFKDITAISLAYDRSSESLFVGHSNKGCSRIHIVHENNSYKLFDKQSIEVLGLVSGDLINWKKFSDIGLLTVGSDS